MALSFSLVPTGSIRVDARAYQFKGGGDASGVTDRLLGVTAWDPIAATASPILLHARDGQTFVVDGHQRVGLATRLGVPALWAVTLDATVSIAEARRIGARLNLQQGTGTAIDVAKLLRDVPLAATERAALPTDSVSGETLRTGEALATLGETAFLRVVNGQVHPVARKNAAYGAIVARLVSGDAEQTDALVALAKTAPESGYQAEQFVRALVADGWERGEEVGLFGAQLVATSLAAPIAKILTGARRVLLTDRAALGGALRHEGRLVAKGNKLNQSANRAGVAEAAALEAALAVYGHSVGPVRTALKALASEVAAGTRSVGSATDAFLGTLDATVRQESPALLPARTRMTTWRYQWSTTANGSPGWAADDTIEATSETNARAAIRAKHGLSWLPNGATVERLTRVEAA